MRYGAWAKEFLDKGVICKHELSALYTLRADGGDDADKGGWIKGEYRKLARDKIMNDPAYAELRRLPRLYRSAGAAAPAGRAAGGGQ